MGQEAGVMSRAGPSTETDPGATEPSEFNVLFARAYPAAVGLAVRVLDRNHAARHQSLALAEDLATEAMARARVRRLRDTLDSLARIIGWTADLCLPHLAGHPGRVPLPAGIGPADVLPEDLLVAGGAEGLLVDGLSLDELQAALMGLPRRVRRVGIVCLGAGLPVEDTAALLDVDAAEVTSRLARVSTRIADRRRIDPELVGPGDGPREPAR